MSLIKHSDNFTSILSRVYGSVTNNNGLWIGWLDLLTASFTITRNHNQSSAEPFFRNCRGLAPFSSSFYDSLQLKVKVTLQLAVYRQSVRLGVKPLETHDHSTPTELRWILYPLGRDHAQKIQFVYCCVRVCWGSHVIATEPIHWRARCSLATVLARTTYKYRSRIFGRVFVWTCLSSNGVFWAHSLMLWANESQYFFLKYCTHEAKLDIMNRTVFIGGVCDSPASATSKKSYQLS
jgi:hypothetical protein